MKSVDITWHTSTGLMRQGNNSTSTYSHLGHVNSIFRSRNRSWPLPTLKIGRFSFTMVDEIYPKLGSDLSISQIRVPQWPVFEDRTHSLMTERLWLALWMLASHIACMTHWSLHVGLDRERANTEVLQKTHTVPLYLKKKGAI